MKKTLIINGSPRKKGETSSMTGWLREHLEGEVREVFTYTADVSPCVDCRYCWTHTNCCVEDEMQDIYGYLIDCDNVVFASPIYFSELSGSFLNLMSRLQLYYCEKYHRKEASSLKPKKGAVLVVYGGPVRREEKPMHTASVLMDLLNVQELHPLVWGDHTDDTAVLDQPAVMEKLAQTADFLNA